MENILEMLFLLFIVVSSIVGSMAQRKKEREQKEDLDIPPQEPQRKPSQPVPPLTPAAGEYKQRQKPVWGELSPKKPVKQHETTTHYEQLERQRERERQFRQRVPEPELRPAPSGGTTLDDVWRELFGLDEIKEETPPPPMPLPRKVVPKPVPKKGIHKVEELTPTKPEPAKAPMLGYTQPFRSLQAQPRTPALLRIAREAEKDPLRTGIIMSEILKRPQPIRPVWMGTRER